MRKKTILIPMLLVLLSFSWLFEATASAPPPRILPPSEPPPGVPRLDEHPAVDVASRLENRIHDLINLERQRAGLPPLAWNRSLHQIARSYSQDMARRRFFSHTDPEGRNFTDRYRRAGFNCASKINRFTKSLGGENIAYNNLYPSIARQDGPTATSRNTEEQLATAVVRQWMTSAGHRRNILTPYFRQEGIGVAIGKDGKVMATQNFC
ncbi:MAG: CAP domain-containing protein [Desulfobulbaceae bacterium]|nr:CAP domain-containing protein [Desulfobulbaceae bacterium]